MAFSELLGEKLLQKDQTVSTADALGGKKAIGLYFSAHWCPPCRGFTPKLAEWYEKDLQGKGLEVVFISSDKDEDQFSEYYGEQPWLALPFSERAKKTELSKKYKVSGIPSFVILNENGEIITKDGRESVSSDPTGEEFPWTPKPLSEILGNEFTSNDGTKSIEDLKGKTLGLYFSAHWCPPCKTFTPKLAETYKKIQAAGKNFEIIFVSSDRDEDQFSEYFGEMPWLALPYKKRKEKELLSKHFGVEGIPSFVILDEDMNPINENGRGAVSSDPEGANFPWYPPSFSNMKDGVDGIDDTPSLCLLLQGTEEAARAPLLDAFKVVAKEFHEAAKAEKKDSEFKFFYADSEETPGDRVKALCGLSDGAHMLILDIGDEGSYYKFEGNPLEVKESEIKAFLQDFKSKTLKRQQFQG